MLLRFTQKSRAAQHRVPVAWHDCAWIPRVVIRPDRETTRPRDHETGAGNPNPATRDFTFHVSRFTPTLMKNTSLPSRRSRPGFTLIELLVVISVIGILAALLLPVLGRVKIKTQIKKAQMETGQIASAILSYESDYSKYPVSSGLANSAAKANESMTYGGTFKTPGGATYDVKPPAAVTNAVVPNSEVMSVLLNMQYWPAAPGVATINLGYVKNPSKHPYLNATMTGDTASPGVGQDGVYRDPWKNPYVITIDLTYNEKARDAFYRSQAVSADPTDTNTPKRGLNGLIPNPNAPAPNTLAYEANSPVMVWSAGPDGMIDPNANAITGANQDNVLSWKQ
jgi:prepilin-type N-terminal cleavage/methylation domain-containing protein